MIGCMSKRGDSKHIFNLSHCFADFWSFRFDQLGGAVAEGSLGPELNESTLRPRFRRFMEVSPHCKFAPYQFCKFAAWSEESSPPTFASSSLTLSFRMNTANLILSLWKSLFLLKILQWIGLGVLKLVIPKGGDLAEVVGVNSVAVYGDNPTYLHALVTLFLDWLNTEWNSLQHS